MLRLRSWVVICGALCIAGSSLIGGGGHTPRMPSQSFVSCRSSTCQTKIQQPIPLFFSAGPLSRLPGFGSARLACHCLPVSGQRRSCLAGLWRLPLPRECPRPRWGPTRWRCRCGCCSPWWRRLRRSPHRFSAQGGCFSVQPLFSEDTVVVEKRRVLLFSLCVASGRGDKGGEITAAPDSCHTCLSLFFLARFFSTGRRREGFAVPYKRVYPRLLE